MKFWKSGVAAAAALCALAGCDKRPEERALIAVEQGQIAFGGDAKACLQRAYLRNEEADEDEETYTWTVEAPEGGCMHFPLVLGLKPEGAAEMSGSGEIKDDVRYHFEAGTADRRYFAEFEHDSNNGILYVLDRDANWTDIRRATQ